MTSTPTGTSDRPLKVAIVGCGGIAHQHALAYAASGRTQLVGLVDIVPGHAEAYADAYGGPTYPDVPSLMGEARPDLVSIATPPGAHAEVAAVVLRAGGSVLIEKPPCPTLAELDVVAEAERAGGGTAYVVFQHRHGSGARRAADLLGSGALGRPLVAVCETLWFRPDSYFDPGLARHLVRRGRRPDARPRHSPDRPAAASARTVAAPHRHRRPAGAAGGVRGRIAGHGRIRERRRRLGGEQPAVTPRAQPDPDRHHRRHAGGRPRVRAPWTRVGHSFPHPVRRRRRAWRDPGVRDDSDGVPDAEVQTSPVDAWVASAGTDVPSNHAAQITRLVDDLLAGRRPSDDPGQHARHGRVRHRPCTPPRCSAHRSAGLSWCRATRSTPT